MVVLKKTNHFDVKGILVLNFNTIKNTVLEGATQYTIVRFIYPAYMNAIFENEFSMNAYPLKINCFGFMTFLFCKITIYLVFLSTLF